MILYSLERIDNINNNNKKETGNILNLTLPIPPSINNDYIKPRAIISRGKPMAMMYETQQAKNYKKNAIKHIKRKVKEQGFKRIDSKFTVVEWTFFFPRTNMDTNNYYKCLLDAITESKEIWEDDNISQNRDKRIYYDSKNPRVELTIYYIAHIGIFDNERELELFKRFNCNKCKKGNKIGQKGGCSIYRKALENRMQDEIDIDFKTGVKTCNTIKEVV